MLAAITGGMRISRALLLKGADPSLSDKRGQTAMEIAVEKGNISVIGVLRKPGLLAFFGIHPPHRPVRNRRFLLIVYSLLLIIGVSSNFLLVLPIWIWYYIVVALEILLLVIVCNKQPGYL